MLVVPEIPWFGNTGLEGLQGALFWSAISTLLGFQSWEIKALTQASWRTLRGLSLTPRNRSLGRKMSALRVIIKQSYNLKKRDEVSEDHAVVSDYLQSHGLYSPWNSPDQNTGVGSVFLFQGIFPTQGLNPGIQHCRWILCQLSLVKGSPGYVYLPLLHFITIYILFSMVLSLKKQNKTLLILSKVFFF